MPAAATERIKHIKTSGKILAWKSFPKSTPKLETAVKLKMNSQDATNPPRIVADCVADSRGLYICNRENRSTEKIVDRTRETDVGTAVKEMLCIYTLHLIPI